MNLYDILIKVWPIILFQLALQVYALYDLFKYKQVKKLNVTLWAFIIVLGELFGPILYFLLGKSDDEVTS